MAIDHTAVEMLTDAKAARDAAGRPDAKGDELLARALRGEYHLPNFRGATGPDRRGDIVTGVVADPAMLDGKRFTYARPGPGGDGSSSHRPAEPMTGPQEGKIYILLRAVSAEVAAQARPWFEANKATMTKRQASDVIDRLKRHAANAPAPVAAPAPAPSATLPASGLASDRSAAWAEWRLHAAELAAMGNSTGARFAVPSATGNNDLDFWVIVKRDGERGPRFYLNRVVGGRPDIRTRMTPEAMVAVARVIRTDARAAMTLYGTEIGSCGRCGRHLTDEDSRARGYGSDCWGKL